jgi:hypothetical protein
MPPFAKRQLFASAAAGIAAAGCCAAMLLATPHAMPLPPFRGAADAPDAMLPRCLPLSPRAPAPPHGFRASLSSPPSRFSHSLHHAHAMPQPRSRRHCQLSERERYASHAERRQPP